MPGSSNDNGYQVYNNVTYNINSSMDISNNNNGTMTAAIVHDNHFGTTANWDTTSPLCAGHHNSLHAFAFTTSNSGLWFYNNLIDGNWGNCATSGLFLEGNEGNPLIFNNVWAMTYQQMNGGLAAINGVGVNGTVQFYNNTLIGQLQSGDICVAFGSGSSFNLMMENNIITGCNTLVATANNITYSKVNYNVYGGCPSGTPWANGGAGIFYNFPNWQALVGDAQSVFNSSTSFAGLNVTGTLLATSPAATLGTSLAGLGIAPLDSDTTGAPRTVWSAGAYNALASVSAPAPPPVSTNPAPTAVTAIAQ